MFYLLLCFTCCHVCNFIFFFLFFLFMQCDYKWKWHLKDRAYCTANEHLVNLAAAIYLKIISNFFVASGSTGS